MATRCIFLNVVVLSARLPLAQEPYYYKAKSFGSQALYNPTSLLLNGSYDIIQPDGHSRDTFAFPCGTASRNVLKDLVEPFGPISRYGWANSRGTSFSPSTGAKPADSGGQIINFT